MGFIAWPEGIWYWQVLRRQEAIVKVSLRVSPPQNTGLKLVMSHIGGGFYSGSGAGDGYIPGDGGAIAAWEAPSDEL